MDKQTEEQDKQEYFDQLQECQEQYDKAWEQETQHPEDCGCSICSGEDAALDRMERGIALCENMFEEDAEGRY